MIEISHEQARRLIRRAAGGVLPEEQWTVLQAHLEGCAECRAYRDRLERLQQQLRHGLRQRWGQVTGPRPGLGQQVFAGRERRAVHRRQARWLLTRGSIALIILILVGLAYRSRMRSLPTGAPVVPFAPGAPTTTVTPPTTVAPTPTPTRSFQGVIALTLNVAGKSQIFLLNAAAGRSGQPELTPFAADSTGGGGAAAQDTVPAWSPDGEWLAFLSNRSGRKQLYVINVAGTHLTQLTSSTDVIWDGPLSWSYDGRWIALVGRRANPDHSTWIYVVPLAPSAADAPGPRAVSGSSSANGWARFSPYEPLLAVQRVDGGIDVYNSELGWSGEVTRVDRLDRQLRMDQQGAFTWALNGLRLVYLADGPYVQASANGGYTTQPRALADATTQMIASGVIGPYVEPDSLDTGEDVLGSVPGVGAFHGLAYQPGGPLLAVLEDLHQTGCWTVHLLNMVQYERARPVDAPGLCVTSRLDSSAWTPDGRWLVLVAQVEDDAAHTPSGEPSLYALDVDSGAYERLLDATAAVAVRGSDAAVRGSDVAVRGSDAAVDLQPVAAAAPEASGVTQPPPGLAGALVYSRPFLVNGQGGSFNEIVRSDPDGAQRAVIVPHDADSSCPVWSPDGQQIAFLSDRDDPNRNTAAALRNGEAGRGLNEIYLMDALATHLRQLSFPIVPYSATALPMYDCPAWSPDGKRIAAVVRSGLLPRLVILRAEDGSVLRSLPIDETSTHASLAWSPDGQVIYLAEPATETGQRRASGAARVASIPWQLPTGITTLLTLPGWDDVQALAISPDGLRLAVVVVGTQENGSRAQAALEIFHLSDLSLAAEMNLGVYGYVPQAMQGVGRLAWEGQQVTLAVPRGPLARDKALLLRFDGERLQLLARVPDALYGWAAYGDWVVTATEGGLYGLLSGSDAAPLLLDPGPITGLDGYHP